MSRATSSVRNPIPPPSENSRSSKSDSFANTISSPVKQSRNIPDRETLEATSNVSGAPQDAKFHDTHLNPIPPELLKKLRSLTTDEQDDLKEIVKPRKDETLIYAPLADLLTSLSQRIYDNLPGKVKKGLRKIEFIPNHRRLMTNHPGKDHPTSYAPDVVGIDGCRSAFENGNNTWKAIPYHRAVSDVEVKPDDTGDNKGASQAISYTWYQMQACPHLPGVYCLSVNPKAYTIGWVDPSGPVRSLPYPWKKSKKRAKDDDDDEELDKDYCLNVLLSYLYSIYVPKAGHSTHDTTIQPQWPATKQPECSATWNITCGGVVYEDCKLISSYPPWGRRTAIFESKVGRVRTIIKDYWIDNSRRFNEIEVLDKVHSSGKMPGVVRAVHAEYVKDATGEILTTGRQASKGVENRSRLRLVFQEVGDKLQKVKGLKELLKVFFDLNEAHRALLETHVLHRDISANNILIHPFHYGQGRNVKYNEGPKFIADVLSSSFPRIRGKDTSHCLLIDFDNSAMLGDSATEADASEALAQRTGTPMYIARAISIGHRQGRLKAHKKFLPMPTLSGKARDLYEEAWGRETYEEYCDNEKTCHGAVIPSENELSNRFHTGKTEPINHQPRHDVESMFWSLYVTSMQLVPVCDEPDVIAQTFVEAWKALQDHQIDDVRFELDHDTRDATMMFIPDYIDQTLHPGFSGSSLPKLLAALSQQIYPEYELIRDEIPKEEHLHEAMRRLLLDCIVEMEDEPDIKFDTEKIRSPDYLKKGGKAPERGRSKTKMSLNGSGSLQFVTHLRPVE